MKAKRYAKRKTRQAYRNLDAAMDKLLQLGELFESDHPDLADQLGIIATTILFAQQTLRQWYKLCWGSEPSDWYAD